MMNRNQLIRTILNNLREELPAKPVESKPLPTGAHRTPPKGYPGKKKQYAIPSQFKYPIDTDEHVRAAVSYFSKPENHGQYSTDEQRTIWRRIIRAAKKHGVTISPEVMARGKKSRKKK